jgi:transposase
MADKQLNATKSAFVAIDISKLRHDILVQPVTGKRRRMTMTNERVDHDRLVDYLGKLEGEVQIGFEATGNYHRGIAWRLLQAGFSVHLISSVALARTREALHNSWDKNDPKDAQVILYMLQAGQVQRYYDPLVEQFNDCQELSKTHEAISKNKTEVLHRLLTHYMPLYFPEISRFRRGSRAVWFFNFLHQFPTPKTITDLSEEVFTEQAWDVVGRKVNKTQLLRDIYATAQSSAGLPVEVESAAVDMYRLVIRQMCQLIAHRDEIERMTQALLNGHPDYERLQQLPGIGPIHALTILAEAGDLRRFGHHRQFLKFCGFDLATHQSGQYRGQSRLSKYGNARLRKAFWMAAQVAIKQPENSFRDKYKRYIAKDQDNRDLKRKAHTAVAVKVARVAYSIIKNETDYRPYYGVR